MANQQIYLFKAARRPLYRKENLHLLAEQRGSVVELAYNRSWVAAEFFGQGAISLGASVFFIYTERPYDTFVPVRSGEIVSATWDDLMLRLQVALGNWVGLDGVDLATFTHIVKQTGPACVPGRKFVGPKRDQLLLKPFYDEREDTGWRTAVDNVVAMSSASEDDPYGGCVFFRSVGLRTIDGELHKARRLPMERGSDARLLLNFYNPHLPDTNGHTLRVQAPETELEVVAPTIFPADGSVELDVHLIGGHPELKLQIGPAPAHHTHVVERFRTRTEDGQPVVTSLGTEGRREELLALYDFLRRNARFEDGDAEDFYERFRHLLPKEHRILEDWGLWLEASGNHERAYRRLNDLDAQVMSEDARFALFRLGLSLDHHSNPIHAINRLSLTSETMFDRLLDELEQLAPRQLARFLPTLALDLPADQLRELDARVGAKLESADAIAGFGEAIGLVADDASWACNYLQERIATLHLADAVVEDKLIELASSLPPGEVPEVEEIVARRIANRLAAGQVPAALADLRRAARSLLFPERQMRYERTADRLIEMKNAEAARDLLIEFAWEACGAGELIAATSALARATGLVTRDGGGPFQPLEEASARVQSAWETFEPVARWRESEEERRRAVLREKLLNKRILVAGGLSREHSVQKLELMTGAKVEWAESFRSESDSLGSYAERIRNQRYALVVYLSQKSGHDVVIKMKDACERSGVPFTYASGAGADGLVNGVWAAMGEFLPE